MAQARYLPTRVDQPDVIRRRPNDVGTIIGHSVEVHPLTPAVLDRPGWQGHYEGASLNNQPGYTNDTLIQRLRIYMFRRAYYIPPALGAGDLSWTAAGPIRDLPTTRFNRNLRPIVGGSHADRWGMHTNLPTGQQAGNALPGKKRMVPGRQNRLTVQRYRGQSYSATTTVLR